MAEEYNVDNIRVLTAREAVRLRPNMYFQTLFEAGNLDALPIEVVCHAIDEYYDGNCSTITITLFDDHFSVKYDAGMSLEKGHGDIMAVAFLTSIFACRNEKKHLSVGEEFCEFGLATVNFASEYCILRTASNGKLGEFRFEFGLLKEQSIEESSPEACTELTFKPDADIFGDLTWSYSGVQKKVEKVRGKLDGLTIELIDATKVS